MQLVLTAIIAYLLGSISFSYIFAKSFKHEDIRTKGSGNAGTTNMLRTYGWKMGVATLVCDILKGTVSALLGLWLAGPNGMFLGSFMAVVGHNFSCFMKFHGGKGIACATGVLLVIQPVPTIIIFAVCVGIVFLTKIMSIGSLLGLVASAVAACCVSGGNIIWNITVIAIAVLGIWSHRENIGRLMRGEERKLSLHGKS